MRAYGDARGVSFDNWSFLTGDAETLDAVVRSHHVGKTRNADGEIEHLVIAFLIDARGRILRHYMGTREEAAAIAADLIAAATSGASDAVAQ
jgi:cytochrome oxidase Cu insertion factor (SCO1/SenC/PrrC family)